MTVVEQISIAALSVPHPFRVRHLTTALPHLPTDDITLWLRRLDQAGDIERADGNSYFPADGLYRRATDARRNAIEEVCNPPLRVFSLL